MCILTYFDAFDIFFLEILLTIYNLPKGKSLVLLFWSEGLGLRCFWQYRLLLIEMFIFALQIPNLLQQTHFYIRGGLWKSKLWQKLLTVDHSYFASLFFGFGQIGRCLWGERLWREKLFPPSSLPSKKWWIDYFDTLCKWLMS